jgi:hypothetical protein
MKPTIGIGIVAAILLLLSGCSSADSAGNEVSAPTTTTTAVFAVGDPPCGEKVVDGDTVTFVPCPEEDPGEAVPTFVEPGPDLVDLRPVTVDSFDFDETFTTLTVTWWSGIAPCSVLDHVEIHDEGARLIVTIWEGSSPTAQTQPCGEMAVWKATVVDLAAPADGKVIVDGAAVELGDPPSMGGNVTLYVSNQSFVIDPVDITVLIDGEIVVDDEFLVLGQHNWIEFPLEVSLGTHELIARSVIGDAEMVTEFTVDDRLYMVVDFWGGGEPESPDPQFSFHASEEPIGFA